MISLSFTSLITAYIFHSITNNLLSLTDKLDNDDKLAINILSLIIGAFFGGLFFY